MNEKETQDNSHGHQTVNLLDFNQSTFHYSQGLVPKLIRSGRRFIFQFVVDDEFVRVSNLYNANFKIGVLDYVTAMKKLKQVMYEAETGGWR